MLALIFVVPLIAGCGPSQQEAQNKLREMGYSFEKKSFFEATVGEELKVVKLFLQGGMSPSVKTGGGRTPIHFAAKAGRAKVVKMLLDNGADVNAKTRDGATPLHFAARAKEEKVVKVLLDKGAETNILRTGKTSLRSGKYGTEAGQVRNFSMGANTALMDAAVQGDTKTIKTLINNGADPNLKTRSGYTALLLAASVSRTTISYENLRTDAIKVLLKNGANPNVRAEGFTPLIRAIEEDDNEAFKALIESGANPDIKGIKDKKALLVSVEKKDIEEVEKLLDSGADTFARNDYGMMPITVASGYNNGKIAKMLLRNGANPNYPGMEGATPLMIATYEGNKEIVKLLLENGADPNRKHDDTHRNSIFGGSEIRGRYGRVGDTALDIARREGRSGIARVLIKNGAE